MTDFNKFRKTLEEKKGLWDNIHAKRKRGEKPNPPGHPDRPTAQDFKDAQKTSKKESVEEKKLTPAEMKKREEIAKAMERDNPGMDMGKKMAIATATAKKVAEASKSDMLCKECGDQFGKPTNEKCMYDAYDELGENWVTKEMYEGLDITEISLDMLTKKISNAKGRDQFRKAMKTDKLKDDLAAMKVRLAGKPTLAKEAKEDDEPASPDEASMALKQLEFIEYAAEEMMDHIKSGKEFPEWFQNKLSKAHGEIEGLHSSMGEHGEDDEEEDMKEAVRRKGAPKMTGDSFAMQRAAGAAHNKAMGRTKTGRKKPERTMTSTQRSLAQLRREETELDEGISNNMRLVNKIKNSGVVKSGSMSKDKKPDAVEVLRRKQQMSNISTSDKDKLNKVRNMLDREKR